MAAEGEPVSDELRAVLHEAGRLGFISGDLAAHVTHALGFWPGDGPIACLDLGTGGGLPGLVLAEAHPETFWLLIERSERRADFLRRGVSRLGLGDRVVVLALPAEDVGRDPQWRATRDLVTARSFASPAVVLEVAAPLLAVGGRLVVSEPPTTRDYDAEVVADLGLVDLGTVQGYRHLRQVRPCPDRYPRRAGVPGRRPLFS